MTNDELHQEEAKLTQTRDIVLPDGSIFTLSFNELFCEKVRKFFELQADEPILDLHLKEFFAASVAGIQ